jgi:hypothetical protein
VRFWRRQPVAKRLEGVELLRQTAHAYDPAAARLPRLLRSGINGLVADKRIWRTLRP